MALKSGLGSRQWASYREGRQENESAQAVVQENRVYPISEAVTASGETVLIAGVADEAIVVTGLHFSKYGGSAVNVSLRSGTGADDKFFAHLKEDGDNITRTLQGGWKLPIGTSLIANLSAAGNIYVEVETETEFIGEQENALADSITFAESEMEIVGKKITDAITFAETPVLVTDFVLDLGDTLAITENLAGATELATSDAISITESNTRQQVYP